VISPVQRKENDLNYGHGSFYIIKFFKLLPAVIKILFGDYFGWKMWKQINYLYVFFYIQLYFLNIYWC
jgi:hypothetical protein